jgi:putative acetyltransferase
VNATIRREQPADFPAIRHVNDTAFSGSVEEGDIVEGLRAEGAVLLSLVAEVEGRVVAHILFSRMWIDTNDGESIAAVALAPMAVLPEYQRNAIGGSLILSGLDVLRQAGERIVIVVGHPEYYPRFGFSPEKAQALESPFPPEAFMALELAPGALDGVRGKVRYPAAFGI